MGARRHLVPGARFPLGLDPWRNRRPGAGAGGTEAGGADGAQPGLLPPRLGRNDLDQERRRPLLHPAGDGRTVRAVRPPVAAPGHAPGSVALHDADAAGIDFLDATALGRGNDRAATLHLGGQ